MSDHEDDNDPGHVHGPDCNHDPGHDPGHDHGDESSGVALANRIIDMANTGMQEGLTPAEIATGIRHAAANFSAFAFFHQEPPRDPNPVVEEFASLFEHYLSMHKPPEEAGQGLSSLIDRAKGEL